MDAITIFVRVQELADQYARERQFNERSNRVYQQWKADGAEIAMRDLAKEIRSAMTAPEVEREA